MDKSILRKALTDSPDPTPGYLFRDIIAMTFADETTQQKLITYLMGKLTPSASVHVLAKTLKIIKIICESGHQDFQKEIQHQSDQLKQFAQFRGTPDSKFGDAYNERVRVAAKEAIEAAFSPRKETRFQIGSGLGNTSDDTSSSKPSFTTGNTISGAGATSNVHMAPMPSENRYEQEMKNRQQKSMGSQIAGNVRSVVSKGFGLIKETVKTDEDRMREAMYGAGYGEFRPVEVPNTGFNGQSTTTQSQGPGSATQWQFASDDTAAAVSTLPEPRLLTPVQKEIERVCSLKETPKRVELSQFLDAIRVAADVSRASWTDVAEAFDAKLAQSVPWQQRLNSLACVEHLIRSEVSSEFAAYFVENPEDVYRNVAVVQSALKEKALKVLKLLQLPERAQPVLPTSHVTQTFSGQLQWESTPSPQLHHQGAPADAATSSGGLDLKGVTLSKSRRGKNQPPEEEKTKLRTRAPIIAPSDVAPVDATESWGTTVQWDSAPSATGWDRPSGVPSTTLQPAVDNDVDTFFTAPQQPLDLIKTGVAQGGSSSQPASSSGAVTLDFLDSVMPTSTSATRTVSAAPTNNGGNLQGMLAQQQQMMQMLSSQMQQIMASDAPPAVKQQQLQLIMRQQQQMLEMMQSLQSQGMAPSVKPEVPPYPSGNIYMPTQAPSQGSASRGNNAMQSSNGNAFAQLNDEMKRSMGF